MKGRNREGKGKFDEGKEWGRERDIGSAEERERKIGGRGGIRKGKAYWGKGRNNEGEGILGKGRGGKG